MEKPSPVTPSPSPKYNPDCAFCEHQPWKHFGEYGVPDLSAMVIAESENWRVKPDILPAHQGGLHFVLRPKIHEINYIYPDNPAELGRLLYGIEANFGGPSAMMKHGDVDDKNSTVMSIRHDHTHLFPDVNIRVIDYIRDIVDQLGIPYSLIRAPDLSYVMQLQQVFVGHPYMYIQHAGNGLFVNDEHEQLGTQQIQRAMQRHYNGGSTFNWKEIQTDPNMARVSITRLSNLYNHNNVRR